MNDENKNIHEFDFSLICEYFSSVERQGPGSVEATVKALSFIDNLNAGSQIVDLGCGTGGQSLTLARQVDGNVTGLDLFPDFINIFNRNAVANGLADRLCGIVGSMEDLPFEKNSLDLIWSEGAIYNIGFQRGLNEWHEYLKSGGYIAVTDCSWFTDNRPCEIEDFWNECYPEVDTISHKIAQLQDAGFIPVAAFVLPEDCWIKNFYEPSSKIQDAFLEKHAGNGIAADLVANQRHECEMYMKYKDYYGYVFYIGRKI